MRPRLYIVVGPAEQAARWRKRHGVPMRDTVRVWERPDPVMRGLSARNKPVELVRLAPSRQEDVIRRHLAIIQASGGRITEHKCERCVDVQPR